MIKHVYQLQAEGLDKMNENRLRTMRSSTVFTTRELAEKRIEKFRELATDPNNIWGLTSNYPIKITVEELEVVE